MSGGEAVTLQAFVTVYFDGNGHPLRVEVDPHLDSEFCLEEDDRGRHLPNPADFLALGWGPR